MMPGSDDDFRHVYNVLREAFLYVFNHVYQAWLIAYKGNAIAIYLVAAVIAAGIISLVLIRVLISTRWINQRYGQRREFLIAMRRHISSTNLFTVGVFFISAILFILFNTLTAGATSYPFTQGDLAAVSFVGKTLIVGSVLVRMTMMARTLANLFP